MIPNKSEPKILIIFLLGVHSKFLKFSYGPGPLRVKLCKQVRLRPGPAPGSQIALFNFSSVAIRENKFGLPQSLNLSKYSPFYKLYLMNVLVSLS